MKALSLSQPWAAVVAAGFKKIENRPWKPTARNLGQGMTLGERFAIHAAKSYDHDAPHTLTLALEERWRSARHLDVKGAIIATARLASVVETSDDPFFFGPYGFVLDEIRELVEPIHCRGALGFWPVPEDVLARMEAA